MERLTPARVHDLIRLREPSSLSADEPMPAWAVSTLQRNPWVVVRRGYLSNGIIPVGVRGPARSQRFAGFVAIAEIADRLSPEDLFVSGRVAQPNRKAVLPALAALDRVAILLTGRGYAWGPAGSVGFELATGEATTTATSDLDLILRQDVRLEPSQAADLLAELAKEAAPVRVDVMLETAMGGVLLADLAAGPEKLLVRTPCGPRLVIDPWQVPPRKIDDNNVFLPF